MRPARGFRLQALLDLIERHEGRVNHAYQDSRGYWTIGVGHLIDKRLGGQLNDKIIDFMLIDDIHTVQRELDAAIPWWQELSGARQIVLASMCFQMGWPRLSLFVKTLAAMKARDYETAAVEMLDSAWYNQTPDRAEELADMMREG